MKRRICSTTWLLVIRSVKASDIGGPHGGRLGVLPQNAIRPTIGRSAAPPHEWHRRTDRDGLKVWRGRFQACQRALLRGAERCRCAQIGFRFEPCHARSVWILGAGVPCTDQSLWCTAGVLTNEPIPTEAHRYSSRDCGSLWRGDVCQLPCGRQWRWGRGWRRPVIYLELMGTAIGV